MFNPTRYYRTRQYHPLERYPVVPRPVPDAQRLALGEDSAGLLMCHISPRQPESPVIAVYANRSDLWKGGKYAPLLPEKEIISTRNKINGYSKKSSKRFRFAISSFSSPLRHMVTLTYPSVYPTARESKKHLDTFNKRLLRAFPSSYFVWKLEPQKRGAPHFHLLGNFATDISLRAIQTWVSVNWFQVVNSGDHRHLVAGTQVVFLNDNTHAMRYIAKYISKDTENLDPVTWANPGRFWGYINKQKFEISRDVFELYPEQHRQLIKLCKKYLASFHTSSVGRYVQKVSNFPMARLFIPRAVTMRLVEFVKYSPISGHADYVFRDGLMINQYTGEIRL